MVLARLEACVDGIPTITIVIIKSVVDGTSRCSCSFEVCDAI